MPADSANPVQEVFGNKTLEDVISVLRGYVEQWKMLVPYAMRRVYAQGDGGDEVLTFWQALGEEDCSIETRAVIDTAATQLFNKYLRAEHPDYQHLGKLMELFDQGDWIVSDRNSLLRVIRQVTNETYADGHFQQRPIRFPLIRSLMGSQEGCTGQERQTLEEFWTKLFNDPKDFPLGYLGMIMLDERKAPELYPILREKNGGKAPYNADSWLHFEGIAQRYDMTLDHKFDS